MYMRVQYNFAKNKTYRDYIDLSGYTGMEVEHGGNTANIVPMGPGANIGKFDPNSNLQTNQPRFLDNVNK